ncbi:methyltransferase domain-containing protein [Goodfellowiella coeruleoviolacea]|uniref:SAM-depedendent methyltransferase n=1 Tax=Goodfellowiella coeruleoviolacea TaxID=334858 RepID=A0AAE3GCP6_9PSEU|nr:methyltransferase domain-containing protein [Goodfellowiella coeruleoviolacea]MCP2163753.1 putative SAM-depedendent methyltransferase [Goodfellowiella coeruleoviolacea]
MTIAQGPPAPERLRLRDRFLERAVRDLLKHDARVRGLDVEARFAGGVAHLTGEVDQPEQLDAVRELVGQLHGVFGVWDRVRVAGRAPVVLDLGSGGTKQYPSNIGVDRWNAGAVDVLADVSRPLPFADACVDRVFVVHVLEHLIDFLPLVDECHRVLRPNGVLHVISPWWRYVNAVADPTHVRLLDVQTIKGICARPGSDRHWYPLHAGCDGATIFADLRPVRDGRERADQVQLARFFD